MKLCNKHWIKNKMIFQIYQKIMKRKKMKERNTNNSLWKLKTNLNKKNLRMKNFKRI